MVCVLCVRACVRACVRVVACVRGTHPTTVTLNPLRRAVSHSEGHTGGVAAAGGTASLFRDDSWLYMVLLPPSWEPASCAIVSSPCKPRSSAKSDCLGGAVGVRVIPVSTACVRAVGETSCRTELKAQDEQNRVARGEEGGAKTN